MRIDTAEFKKSVYSPKDILKSAVPEIVFAGRSNVGKSSLINTLLSRKGIAKTSATPGKTIHVNYFLINSQFYFVDLPGYGYARASANEQNRWRALVEKYFSISASIRLVVHLVDIRRGRMETDKILDGWLQQLGIPFAIVLTKSDKLNRSRLKEAVMELTRDVGTSVPVVAVSSQTGAGIQELWAVLDGILLK